MIRVLWLIMMLFGALRAEAEQIAVRSGEHGDFTRLVVDLPAGATWALRREGDTYLLRAEAEDIRFDLSQVFRLIARDRVQQMSAPPASPELRIAVASDVIADARQLASGSVVLDFRTAPLAAIRPRERPVVAVNAPPSEPLPSRGSTPIAGAGPRQSVLLPAPPPREPSLTLPQVDGRVSEAERDLLHQLGRAASQGLIHLDIDALGVPAGADPLPQDPEGPQKALGHLAIQSETAFDRAGFGPADPVTLSDSGARCLPDVLFDPAAWLDGSPPAAQIAAARSGLMGEFDRPIPDKVITLARTYVALGFGAEARLLLRSLESPEPEAAPLDYMARIIEGDTVPIADPIVSMGDCAGNVALWAFLGREGAQDRWDYDLAALQRAFSALPPGLRAILGPETARRLIAIGAEDVARGVRKTIERAPADDLPVSELIAAHLGEGNEARLAAIKQGNDARAVEALILFVEGRVARAEAVDDATIAQAQALAAELVPSPEGYRVLRAQILGNGSVGRFSQAFAGLAEWPETAEADLRQKTATDLVAQLAQVPSDPLFIAGFYENRGPVEASAPDRKTRLRLGERLVSQGFTTAGKEMIAPMADLPEGRLLLARIALQEGDGAAAVTHLAGLDGPQAARYRGEAAALMGEFGLSRQAFQQAGDAAAAREAAWRSGDWQAMRSEGADPRGRLLALYDSPPPVSGEGPLGQARALLERSRAERAAFAEVMTTLADPEPAADKAP